MGKPRLAGVPPRVLVAVIEPPDEQPPMLVKYVDPHPYFATWPGQLAMTDLLNRHVPADHRLILGFDPAGGLQ